MYTFHKIENQINILGFFTFFSREYPNHFVGVKENHNFWEVVYIKQGNALMMVDDQSFNMSAGDILFIKPMSLHMTINNNSNTLTKYIISFSASGSGLDMFENKSITLNDNQKNSFEEIFKYLYQLSPQEFPERAFSLFDDCHINPTLLQILKNKFELFLLNDMKADNLLQYNNIHSIPRLITDAIGVMKQNIHLNLTIDDIAAMSHTSAPTLKKLFQKHINSGVHEYFLNLKIAEAIILLGTGMSVSETADKLSFKSQSYFSTAFKRITGTSPTNAEFLAKTRK